MSQEKKWQTKLSKGYYTSLHNCLNHYCTQDIKMHYIKNAKKSPWELSMIDRLKEVNPIVMLLVICFAFSSWIDIYGVMVEFPILVHVLPEGWDFPAYTVAILQCANISPLVYSIVNKLCHGNIARREVIMAYIIMGVGTTALILLTLFWDHTVWIAGKERSLAALLLILFLSMVDTTSCVVYLPYMAKFKEHYMPAYVAGEEMGGLITGIVGMIQGAGLETCFNKTIRHIDNVTSENFTDTGTAKTEKKPLFSVSSFFSFLAGMMIVSMISFTLLNTTKFARREMVGRAAYRSVPLEEQNEEMKNSINLISNKMAYQEQDTETDSPVVMAKSRLVFCCFVYAWSSFLVFGLMPSINSYSTLPYGAVYYTLAVRLISLANPILALLAFFKPIRVLPVLGVMTCIHSCMVAYHFVLAMMSPNPPLMDHIMGPILSVSTAVLLSGMNAYCRACIAAVLRTEGGHQALFIGGACIQFGAFVGGITGFILTSVIKIFEDCSQDT